MDKQYKDAIKRWKKDFATEITDWKERIENHPITITEIKQGSRTILYQTDGTSSIETELIKETT